MKGSKILALLLCLAMLLPAFVISGAAITTNVPTASHYDTFDYDSFDAMAATGLWEVEDVIKADKKTAATAPTLENGVLKMKTKNSVQFNWTKVEGLPEYSTSNVYVFDFDFTVTNSGSGSYWDDTAHTRVLYVAWAGYYNQIEINNKDAKVRAGGTYVTYSSSKYVDKTMHATLVLQGTTCTSTITDASGNVVATGSRTSDNYDDMTVRDGGMKYLVLRCEDGAVNIDNFSFSCQTPDERASTYTCNLEHVEGGKASLKMNGVEIFSLTNGVIRLCGSQISGDYSELGTYQLTVLTNAAQSIMTIEVIMPNGGVLRRGYAHNQSVNTFIWDVTGDSVTNEKITKDDVVSNPYTLETVEPTVSGFGANVYNLVTAFDNPQTSRLLAWTAKSAFVNGATMAARYRVKGTTEWTKVAARRMSEVSTVGTEDYYKADLLGLTANTEYEYQIGIAGSTDSDNWSNVYTFKTAEENIGDFKFIAIGDTQSLSWGGLTLDNKGYTYAQAAILAAMKDVSNPAFILHTGDVTDRGSNLSMWNWYFKALGEYGATIPHFATVGNHDTWSDDNNNYFALHFNHPDNGANALDKSITSSITNADLKKQINNFEDTIYSYNYGDVHFIVLNSGSYCSDDVYILKAQRQWLINDLEANKDAKWTVLMVHEPVYHRKGGNEDRPWLYDTIEGYGVDLVIQGHSHLVTRTYPMKGGEIVTKDSPDLIRKGTGTVYTTVGSTTMNHDKIGDTGVEECMVVITTQNDQPTYAVVSVEEDRLVMTVKQLDGFVVDEFSIVTEDYVEDEEETQQPDYSFSNKLETEWEGENTVDFSWGYTSYTVNGQTNWAPDVQWYTSENVTFDNVAGTITVTGANTDYEMQFLAQNVLEAGAAGFTIDVYFDGKTFAGINVFSISSGINKSLIRVDEEGYLLDANGQRTSGRMTVGWNTLHVYAIPQYDSQGTFTGLTIYSTLGTGDNPTTYSYGITQAELAEMNAYTLTVDGKTDLKSIGALRIRPHVKATYDGTNYRSYTFRNIRVMNLSEADDLVKVTYEGVSSMTQYVSASASTALPLGQGLWVDEEGNYYRGGDMLTPDSDITLKPLKLTGANLILTGEVTINMFIYADIVNAYGADGAYVISGGKTYVGTLVGDRYVFATQGIRACDMNQTQEYAVVLTFRGEAVTSLGATEYSPMAYAQRMYAKQSSSEELKDVILAMVQYAYAAEVSAKGTSQILDDFNAATGESLTFSTSAYTVQSIQVDTSAVDGKAKVGATLTQGIQLQFAVTEDVTALEVVGLGTYQTENGVITIDELHAGLLTTKLTLRFHTAEGTLTATYCIANFLDSAAVSGDYTQAQQQLAMATSIYMSAVSRYAAGK